MIRLRDAHRSAFLTRAGWQDAVRHVLAGDASNRRYDRLTNGPAGKSAVLMDAPPERDEDIRPFVAIANHLRGLGLSAPEILAQDETQGFLLLEDLGDDLFARLVERQPSCEAEIYRAAVDVLCELHRHPVPQNVCSYDVDSMTGLAGLAWDWYAPDASAKADALSRLGTHLTSHDPDRPVLVLRDYHAENLLWLPGRSGIARVGLLDFQDGAAGHPAYDLVSLTQDARRDVPATLAWDLTERYIAQTGHNRAAFLSACAVIAAQRNLRILGVFARLSLHFGKPHYIDLIPRVWAHLDLDLQHQDLADLRRAVLSSLPEPTPGHLNDLKDRCGTIPNL